MILQRDTGISVSEDCGNVARDCVDFCDVLCVCLFSAIRVIVNVSASSIIHFFFFFSSCIQFSFFVVICFI